MNSAVKTAAAIAAPALLSRIKLRYIALGVAAYYGLRLLKSKGVLPKQADAALGFIDQGIDMAKETVGMGSQAAGASAPTGVTHSVKSDPKSIHADVTSSGVH